MTGDPAARWRAGHPGYGRLRLRALTEQAYRQLRHEDAAETAQRRAARGGRQGFASVEEWRLFLHAELSRLDHQEAQRRTAWGRRHGRAGALYCQEGRP